MRILPWALLAALLLIPGKTGPKGIRSIRNRNPGNIKLTNIPWKGKVPNAENTDGVFEQFTDFSGFGGMIWGTRAMVKELIDSILNDGNNNLTKLITDWTAGDSPASQANYINYVSMLSKIGPLEFIQPTKETLRKLVFSMADFEAGQPGTPVVTFDMFEQSYNLV